MVFFDGLRDDFLGNIVLAILVDVIVGWLVVRVVIIGRVIVGGLIVRVVIVGRVVVGGLIVRVVIVGRVVVEVEEGTVLVSLERGVGGERIGR